MQISIKNLEMIYPNGKRALQEISMDMNSPNLIGLLGPNGAGKSTLMKLLTASLLPTNGNILIDGAQLLKNEQSFKARLGYLPQSFGLYDDLNVTQFLNYMAALKGIKDSKDAVHKVLVDTNLLEKRRSKIKALSGGQRQRVGIAQALLGEPEFLILDEPTVGLDPEERINFRNLFSHIAQDRLVMLSTHIIEDIQSVCNQLIVINHGKIMFTGTPEALTVLARGHVGVFEERPDIPDSCRITSRVNTADGIVCRGVAKEMPAFAHQVEPTLEDAYLYLVMEEVGV